jgi:branched-chain amino acid transport system permease protein
VGRWEHIAAAGVVAALALLPLVADAYVIKVATEVLIFALFAFSLNLLVSTGGLVSFGHAAYFGLGAYGAALSFSALGLRMEAALALAPLVAAVGAAVVGIFVVRLSGIYLAMLTLAAAQIVYAVAFQWVEVTGGDNGLLGIWPAPWASGRTIYYWLTLAVTGLAVAGLRHVIYAPFGYGLRATRDSVLRAEAIGIDVRRQRWLAFVLAGAAAGVAGGLYVFSKGSIDPSALGIPTSVDAPHHAAARRARHRHGAARGCRGAAGAEGPGHAGDAVLAAGARPEHHRHGADLPGRARRAVERLRERLAR